MRHLQSERVGKETIVGRDKNVLIGCEFNIRKMICLDVGRIPFSSLTFRASLIFFKAEDE